MGPCEATLAWIDGRESCFTEGGGAWRYSGLIMSHTTSRFRPSASFRRCRWLSAPDARSSTVLGVLLATFVLADPALAVTITLLESTATVSGSIAAGPNLWSDSDASTDLDPSIQVQRDFGGGTNANSFVNAGHNLPGQRLVMSTGFVVGSSGDARIDHAFEVRFSIDGPASFSLTNNNATGGFPRALAATAGGTASLVYELRTDAGALVSAWSAPSSPSAGPYATGTIPAGTYRWSAVGSALIDDDPCCVVQFADITGNTRLSFVDAPVPNVPLSGPAGVTFLLGAMLTAGARFAGLRAKDR